MLILWIDHENSLATMLVEFVVHQGRLAKRDMHLVYLFLADPVNNSGIKCLFDALKGVFIGFELRVVPSLYRFKVIAAIYNPLINHVFVLTDVFALYSQVCAQINERNSLHEL